MHAIYQLIQITGELTSSDRDRQDSYLAPPFSVPQLPRARISLPTVTPQCR